MRTHRRPPPSESPGGRGPLFLPPRVIFRGATFHLPYVLLSGSLKQPPPRRVLDTSVNYGGVSLVHEVFKGRRKVVLPYVAGRGIAIS